MSKCTTKTYTIKFQLDISKEQESLLTKRFQYWNNIYNHLMSFVKKQIELLTNNPDFVKAKMRFNELHKTEKNSSKKSEEYKHLKNKINNFYKWYWLREYDLQIYIKKYKNKYKKHIESNMVKNIASEVWCSVQQYLYGNWKKLRYKPIHERSSLTGKTNRSWFVYKDEKIVYKWMIINMKMSNKDVYHRDLIKNNRRVKYCQLYRVKRSWWASKRRWKYYVILYIEGIPPKKPRLWQWKVWIDWWLKTLWYYSEHWDIWLVTLKNMNIYKDKIAELQTIINESEKKKWHYLRHKVNTLHRKQTALRKQYTNTIANNIVWLWDEFIGEKMEYEEMKTEGATKKTMAKIIQDVWPSSLITTINQKLWYYDMKIQTVWKYSFRASQYNHDEDWYVPKNLATRYIPIKRKRYQRDLYSAFLLLNANDNLKHVDRDLCLKRWGEFKEKHNEYIKILKNDGNEYPSSYGLSDITL